MRKGYSSEFSLELKVAVLMTTYHQRYEDIMNMPKRMVNFYYELANAENEYMNKKMKK